MNRCTNCAKRTSFCCCAFADPAPKLETRIFAGELLSLRQIAAKPTPVTTLRIEGNHVEVRRGSRLVDRWEVR